MSHLAQRISSLEARLAQGWQALALDASAARLVEIEADMNDPNFWNDQALARKYSQEAADIKKEIGRAHV